jgi:type IV secretory pathway TrbD component
MLRTSTTFDKDRVPGASIPLLLNFYQQELEYQRVHSVAVQGDALHFENRSWRLGKTRFGNQYFCFSMGMIHIKDSGDEYQVFFEGSLRRILVLGGTLAGVCALSAFIASGFNWIAIGLGVLIFLLVSVVNYIYTLLFFPVYFADLRNEMEESLQNLP